MMLALLQQLLRHGLTQLGFFSTIPVVKFTPTGLAISCWITPAVAIFLGIVIAAPGYLLQQLVATEFIQRQLGENAAIIISQQSWLWYLLLAVATLAWQLLLTGALHEDGLGDCCDGLTARDPAAARLRAKDPRCGVFAVCALIITCMLRVLIYAIIIALQLQLLLIPLALAVARVSVLQLVAVFQTSADSIIQQVVATPATASARDATIGQPSSPTVSKQGTRLPLVSMLIATAVLLAIILYFFTVTVAILLFCINDALLLLLAYYLTRKFAGLNGDILGALIIVSEIITLTILLAAS